MSSLKRFRTQFTPNYNGEKGEKNTMPSETVPDQNLSVRQLLINHSRNLTSNVMQRQGEYFDSPIPNITDLTELDEHKRNLAAEIKEAESQAEQEKQKAEDLRIEAAKKKLETEKTKEVI